MVKEGYKQTEIGMIPEDWEVLPLQEIAPLQRGFDLPYSKMQEGQYPVVFSNGIGAHHNNYMVKGPGVVTGRSGTIGKVHYIQENYWPHNTSLWVTDFHGNCPRYIFYLFKTIQWDLFNSGSSIPTLNRNDIHSAKYAIPPIQEQERIAEALSDIDELISSLEKLIAKKKAIKQGAMQQLLTGKTRLLGFKTKWKTKHLGELCDLINGGTPSTTVFEYWNGTIKWCTPSDITACKTKYINNTMSSITEKGLKNSSATLLPEGAILLCTRATIGEARIASCPICTNQGFKSLIAHKEVCNEWLYYLVITLKPQMIEKAIGSTFLEISKENLSNLRVSVPEFKEQKTIALVLSTMDNEIETLEEKLWKTQIIKQGMMQQLLTGKIRLM